MKRKILTSLFTLLLCAASILTAQAAPFCPRACGALDSCQRCIPFCSAAPDAPSQPGEAPGAPSQPDEVPDPPSEAPAAPSDTPLKPDAPAQPDEAPETGASALYTQLLSLVNAERAANGLSALTLSESLCQYAAVKAQDLHNENYFSHTSPTYGSPFDMMKSFGISYRSAGENIAMGYSTPASVMAAWMRSSGHRANILSPEFTTLGVGYVEDGGYWVQWFIG